VDKLFAMALAAGPVFYDTVQGLFTLAILIVFLVIEIIAFVNCLTQKSEAFPVVGSLTKPAWLAILGAALLVTLVCGLPNNGVSFLGFVAITATAIYMLDVRPALRDAADGSGSW
jgi:Protein of unknown function (DUF2516)